MLGTNVTVKTFLTTVLGSSVYNVEFELQLGQVKLGRWGIKGYGPDKKFFWNGKPCAEENVGDAEWAMRQLGMLI